MSDASPADLVLAPHEGALYQACLRALHQVLKPRAYLEIGAPEGETVAFAECPSVCVDPRFRMPPEAIGRKPSCLFFQMDSDAFFAAHDPVALLGRPVDLAYLDGMHLCEHLLRDFICTERACTPRSLVLLHDCIPLDLHMAVRDRDDSATRARSVAPAWWTGDVWKTVNALHRHRPDLYIRGFRAPPTGLVLIGRLSPNSDVLGAKYHQIVREMQEQGSEEDYRAYLDWLQPASTDALAGALVDLNS